MLFPVWVSRLPVVSHVTVSQYGSGRRLDTFAGTVVQLNAALVHASVSRCRWSYVKHCADVVAVLCCSTMDFRVPALYQRYCSVTTSSHVFGVPGCSVCTWVLATRPVPSSNTLVNRTRLVPDPRVCWVIAPSQS